MRSYCAPSRCCSFHTRHAPPPSRSVPRPLKVSQSSVRLDVVGNADFYPCRMCSGLLSGFCRSKRLRRRSWKPRIFLQQGWCSRGIISWLPCHLLANSLMKFKEVITKCALECPGRWDLVVDAKPTTSLEFEDHSPDRDPHGSLEDLGKLVEPCGSDEHRRCIFSTRAARLARRAVVAAGKGVRNALSDSSESAVHRRPNSTKDSSGNGPVVIAQQTVQSPHTTTAKLPSALSRSPPSPPTWMPSSCGPPGSTCGGVSGSGSGNVAERKIGAEQKGFAVSPLSLYKIEPREAESQPVADAGPSNEHPPGWTPSSCGFAGATCGGSGGSGSGTLLERQHDAEKEKSSSLPSSLAHKRDAEPRPAADRRPLAQHSPSWAPASCTTPGITCGVSKGARKGSDSGGTADADAGSGPPASHND